MNTTHRPLQSQPTYRDIAANQLKVGDVFIHGKVDKTVTALTLTEDGYATVRWHGGLLMCELNAPIRVQIKSQVAH